MPYQNFFQVAEVVPTNLACIVAEMESQLRPWCVVPEGPSCYETGENALDHCLVHFHPRCCRSWRHWWNPDITPISPRLIILPSVSLEYEWNLSRFLSYTIQADFCFTKGKHLSSLLFIHFNLVCIIARRNFFTLLRCRCHYFLFLAFGSRVYLTTIYLFIHSENV